jgi:hypothetical protein
MRMHYVTHRSHWVQKHKFGVTCPGAFFMESIPIAPSMKNSVSTFRVTDGPKCTMWPSDHTGWKNTSSVSRVLERFLWKPQRAHPSFKNSASMFRGPYAPEYTTWPIDPTGLRLLIWIRILRQNFYISIFGMVLHLSKFGKSFRSKPCLEFKYPLFWIKSLDSKFIPEPSRRTSKSSL